MARRGRPKQTAPSVQLSPETKRGITGVLLVVIAAIAALALFGLAGPAGRSLSQGLGAVFGWGRWLVPPLLIYTCVRLLTPAPRTSLPTVGVVVTTIAVFGFLQLAATGGDLSAEPGSGGGYIGLAIALPLVRLLGWLASLIAVVGIAIVGVLITFNTTLQQIFAPAASLRRLTTWRTAEPAEPTEAAAFTEHEVAGELNRAAAAVRSKAAEPAASGEPTVAQRRPPRPAIDLPLDLLTRATSKPTSGDIHANQEKIRATLATFGIAVEMGEVNVGPTVTQFTLKPSDGVKLSQIVTLQNDLALALAAHPIRIEAPIPGRSLVGIEVPNQAVAVVKLRDILESEAFVKRRSALAVSLGKDVAGEPAIADLGRMPHCLIAGATGSGKSVCLNSFILSLLYQNSPDTLKLILVDPKRVELNVYNDIPHLLTPVIHETEHTINALRWTVEQMDHRYRLLAEVNARNLEAYNDKVLVGKLPYIVVVVDELADLMAVAARDVEAAIIRLAQMARAVGIHLVLATQRPSVNVLTGLIKANITTRLAFAVASQTDSRTILDSAGAEKLLGRGDMLYVSAESSKPRRLQGCYVSDEEIERVVRYLKDNAEPEYDDTVVEKRSSGVGQSPVAGFGGSDDDPLLGEAEAVVTRADKASASLLQRRLRIGYARAARLLDLLEERGVVGPADGAKPREILVRSGDWDGEAGGESGDEPAA